MTRYCVLKQSTHNDEISLNESVLKEMLAYLVYQVGSVSTVPAFIGMDHEDKTLFMGTEFVPGAMYFHDMLGHLVSDARRGYGFFHQGRSTVCQLFVKILSVSF
jgi:hypothetical protein